MKFFFLGGAAQINMESTSTLDRFQTVNGIIVNCYSDKDWILGSLNRLRPKYSPPIGIGPFEIKNQEKTSSIFSIRKKIFNHKVSLWHTQYRVKLFTIFTDILKKIRVK